MCVCMCVCVCVYRNPDVRYKGPITATPDPSTNTALVSIICTDMTQADLLGSAMVARVPSALDSMQLQCGSKMDVAAKAFSITVSSMLQNPIPKNCMQQNHCCQRACSSGLCCCVCVSATVYKCKSVCVCVCVCVCVPTAGSKQQPRYPNLSPTTPAPPPTSTAATPTFPTPTPAAPAAAVAAALPARAPAGRHGCDYCYSCEAAGCEAASAYVQGPEPTPAQVD